MNFNSKKLDIIVSVPSDGGWTPVWQMINLLDSYTDGSLIKINPEISQKNFIKIFSFVPRMRIGARDCIFIVSDPGIAYSVLSRLRSYLFYNKIFLWVIDSFWVEKIPRIISSTKFFDKCYVMDKGDISDWRDKTSINLDYLPWGTDTLGINYRSLVNSKTNDIVRVGRQPNSWDSDSHNKEIFDSLDISYLGRPPTHENIYDSEAVLEKYLFKSKFELCFNNLVSPAKYTHPIKSYITSRWVKGIAYGNIMLGVIPQSESALDLIPDWSHVEIDPDSVIESLPAISDSIRSWDSGIVLKLHKWSVDNFDWRTRFKKIFDDLGYVSAGLDFDLGKLRERSEELSDEN